DGRERHDRPLGRGGLHRQGEKEDGEEAHAVLTGETGRRFCASEGSFGPCFRCSSPPTASPCATAGACCSATSRSRSSPVRRSPSPAPTGRENRRCSRSSQASSS